ncbi:MAG TPA: DUF3037 domain-containing protein [Daejeonella sp.]|nr:DUF3037 domain-containing protein [Daejeonella sp.]
MQEKHIFEYAVIRVMPRVEREEFINTGIILYCKSLKYLNCSYVLRQDKLRLICAELDCQELEKHLIAFKSITLGQEKDSPIAFLPQTERFRWLTATRSTVLQCSKVHTGLTLDPDETFNKLLETLVL